jgi:uncharacterized protein (TIGR02246 family)
MGRDHLLAGVIMIGSAIPALSQAPTDEAVRKQVDAYIAKWKQTFERKDAAGMAELFAENADYISFSGHASGKEQIRNLYEGQFKAGFSNLEIRTLKIHTGPSPYAVGEATPTGSGQSGPMNVEVRWLAAYETDGTNLKVRAFAATPKALPRSQQGKCTADAAPRPHLGGTHVS